MLASGNCCQIKRSRDFCQGLKYLSLFPRSSDNVQEPQLVSSAALAETPGCEIETFISASSAIFYFFTLVCPFIFTLLHFWPWLVTGQHTEMGRGGSRKFCPGWPYPKISITKTFYILYLPASLISGEATVKRVTDLWSDLQDSGIYGVAKYTTQNLATAWFVWVIYQMISTFK